MTEPDPVWAMLMATGPGDNRATQALELLDALLARPAWHADAACRGVGPSLFFDALGKAREQAAEMCRSCPVAGLCADAGAQEADGLWGGLRWQRGQRRAA